MKFMKHILWCVLTLQLTNTWAQGSGSSSSSTQKSNLAAVTQVVSTTTVNALSASYLSSMMGGMGVYRWQLGDASRPADSRGGLAAGDQDSPWSLWATPVRSTFRNNIEPITSSGAVTLGILGLEYRGDGPWMGGVSLSMDRLSATTRNSAVSPETTGSLSGSGFTLAPYAVYQFSPTRALDLSWGGGQSNMDFTGSAGNSTPVDRRRLASVGLTDIHELGQFFLMLKAGHSWTKDAVDASTGNSETLLKQTRLGGQVMMPGDMFSPFVAYYQLFNTLTAKGDGTAPVEYSSTGQLQLGLNVASGPVFGSMVVQHEQSRQQFRVYIGYRY
jgi:hypothetical protein